MLQMLSAMQAVNIGTKLADTIGLESLHTVWLLSELLTNTDLSLA